MILKTLGSYIILKQAIVTKYSILYFSQILFEFTEKNYFRWNKNILNNPYISWSRVNDSYIIFNLIGFAINKFMFVITLIKKKDKENFYTSAIIIDVTLVKDYRNLKKNWVN